jgi:KDO2-lipid IV(A) lauroyltransferase
MRSPAQSTAQRDEWVETPHGPESSSLARRLLGRFHVTGIFWYRFHLWGITHVPSWGIRVIIGIFTTFFYFTLRRIRRAIAENLEPVLGPAGFVRRELRIYRTMWNHAWCNSERFERLATDRRFDIRYQGVGSWKEATNDVAKGVVVATAHVGAWDVSSFLPSLLEGRKAHVVREQEPYAAAQRFVEELYGETAREHFEIHYSRNNPGLGGALLAALRRGEFVGLQGDRAPTGGRTVETEVFGRPFPMPAGPAALARGANVPLVPVFCFREGRRKYRLDIRPAVEVHKTDDLRADLQRTMQGVARELERAIRQAPYQWFCFRRVWEGDPPLSS